MQFVGKAIIERAQAELNALPVGTGDPNVAMAVVGLSNLIINNSNDLELEPAHVPERALEGKDPLEGMSESKVDFDNPAPVPSLIAAVDGLLDKKEHKWNPCSMRVRAINGVKVVSLTNAAAYADSALPAEECVYTKRIPKELNQVGDFAIPESMLGLLLGQQRRFFAEKRKAGFPCRVAYSSGKRRYIRIRDGVAFMKMYNIAYGVNREVMDSLLQAISNN